jgi:hypothetical protein
VLVLRATIYALSSLIPPLTYNRLGQPLADLSRSHPLTVGTPGRGDRELFICSGDLFDDDMKDISTPTYSLLPSDLIVRLMFLFCGWRARKFLVSTHPPMTYDPTVHQHYDEFLHAGLQTWL